jgi:hypothetical protein
MKNEPTGRRLRALLWMFAGLGLAGSGACTDAGVEAEAPRELAAPLVSIASEPCTPLLAGQTLAVGEVCARIDGAEVAFRYRLTDGWELMETHLWVGSSLADMPQTRTGNPKPGQFPWGGVASGTTAELRVPLSTFGLKPDQTTCEDLRLIVAAHAAVRKRLDDGVWQQETAWGDGTRFVEKGSWGTWFALTLRCGPDGPTPVCGETAFARHAATGQCFIGSPWVTGPARWGWTNGPFPEGTWTFQLWAGAAQCILSRGAHVGDVTLRYQGGTAEVILTARAPYSFAATHLYVGSEPLPRSRGEYTVSPGLFPFQHTLTLAATGDSYVVTGLSGPIWLVFHAESCRPPLSGDHSSL